LDSLALEAALHPAEAHEPTRRLVGRRGGDALTGASACARGAESRGREIAQIRLEDRDVDVLFPRADRLQSILEIRMHLLPGLSHSDPAHRGESGDDRNLRRGNGDAQRVVGMDAENSN